MGQQFVIDTNILIYHLANKIPTKEQGQVQQLLSGDFLISVITEIELLSWDQLTQTQISQIKSAINPAQIIYLDGSIKDETIRIRRSYGLKLGDAIIAATALLNGRHLCTRNSSDFKKITSLQLYNPFD